MSRGQAMGAAVLARPARSILSPWRLSRRSRIAWAGFFFVLPALLHIAVFKIYPLLQALRLSFYRYDLLTPPVFTGLANYRALWENPLFHQSFWVSVKY